MNKFEVGQRVKLKKPYDELPVGTEGEVTALIDFPKYPYRVRFDIPFPSDDEEGVPELIEALNNQAESLGYEGYSKGALVAQDEIEAVV